ncbi:MAG: heavy metal-binding domain-containing protein [Candidatus Obscuribacterales bacterium]
MFFWKKKPTEAELAQQKRQEEAIAALTNGDIPQFAKHRLLEHANRDDRFFSSDLTTNEFMLMREAGVQPLCLVMGSAFFNVSFWGRGINRPKSGPMRDISAAQLMARRNALQRMEKEAQLLGADGVVGVRVVRNQHAFIDGQVEFTAIGTAVKIPGHKSNGTPFMSALSAKDFWQLHNAGFVPKGLALGCSVYYAAMDRETRNSMFTFWGNNARVNQEIRLYTQSFYEAREEAMNSLTRDGVEHNADGVIGVTVDETIREQHWEISNVEYIDLLIDFTVMGTTIEKIDAPSRTNKPPLIMIDLATRSQRAIDINFDLPSYYNE